jgi:hypothetical protein
MTQETKKTVANVLITGEDAQVFLAFKQNREKFLVLLTAGVFDLDAGKVVVNVHNHQIQTVHIDRMTYKRESVTLGKERGAL